MNLKNKLGRKWLKNNCHPNSKREKNTDINWLIKILKKILRNNSEYRSKKTK